MFLVCAFCDDAVVAFVSLTVSAAICVAFFSYTKCNIRRSLAYSHSLSTRDVKYVAKPIRPCKRERERESSVFFGILQK